MIKAESVAVGLKSAVPTGLMESLRERRRKTMKVWDQER